MEAILFILQLLLNVILDIMYLELPSVLVRIQETGVNKYQHAMKVMKKHFAFSFGPGYLKLSYTSITKQFSYSSLLLPSDRTASKFKHRKCDIPKNVNLATRHEACQKLQ